MVEVPSSESVTGMAVVGAAAGSPAGAVTLALLASGCSRKMPWIMHITGLVIDGSEYAGALVANFSIALATGLLCWGALKAVAALFPSMTANLGDLQGYMRLPSAPLVVFIFMYQGSTLASMGLVLSGSKTYLVLSGFVALTLFAAIPFALTRVVMQAVPEQAVYARAVGRKRLTSALLGPGEWVNTTPGRMWVQRFACITRMYKQGHVWYFALELAANFTISAIKSAKSDTYTGCGHIHVAIGVVLAVMLFTEGMLLPRARPRTAVVVLAFIGLNCSAMFLMAHGYYTYGGSKWSFDAAGDLLFVSQWVMIVGLAADLLTEIFVFLSGRRTNLQDNVLDDIQTAKTKAGKAVEVEELDESTSELGTSVEPYTPFGQSVQSHRGAGGRGGAFVNARPSSPDPSNLARSQLTRSAYGGSGKSLGGSLSSFTAPSDRTVRLNLSRSRTDPNRNFDTATQSTETILMRY